MSKDIIEDFLANGGPEAPESRATKWDLERHIERRDELLRALREVLLGAMSQEVIRASKKKEKQGATVESLTSEQLTALYGSPIPALIKSKQVENRGDVETFVNEIGAHKVLSITAYSHGAAHGQRYTVFYRE